MIRLETQFRDSIITPSGVSSRNYFSSLFRLLYLLPLSPLLPERETGSLKSEGPNRDQAAPDSHYKAWGERPRSPRFSDLRVKNA